jgi:CheY-like chemotaxis protein
VTEKLNAINATTKGAQDRAEGAAMRRILVVDDDPHVGQAIQVWLKHHGFRVSSADSGPGGLKALDNATFDLMIVDVFMPQMRGFETIRLFHERAPAVPLIAISGHAFADTEISAPEFVRLATRLGAARCLRKPFKPATLLSVIDQCLADAEPHRRRVVTLEVAALGIATLGAVAGYLSDAPDQARSGGASIERPAATRRVGGRSL